VTFDKPIVALSTQAAAAANADIAGSVGHGILRQFNITFDYGNGFLYFERNTELRPAGRVRSLRHVDRARRLRFRGRRTDQGRAGGQGGARPGNVIVAIDGKPWSALGLNVVRQDFQGRARAPRSK
jgi:hypothetical protein